MPSQCCTQHTMRGHLVNYHAFCCNHYEHARSQQTNKGACTKASMFVYLMSTLSCGMLPPWCLLQAITEAYGITCCPSTALVQWGLNYRHHVL